MRHMEISEKQTKIEPLSFRSANTGSGWKQALAMQSSGVKLGVFRCLRYVLTLQHEVLY